VAVAAGESRGMTLDSRNKLLAIYNRLGQSVREFNSQHSPIIAGELFLPELFLPEETADQLIIDGKIGSAGYMIQHPCGIASYQGKSSRACVSALGPGS
jgi:hypothetical protein